jgi:catechol 2,3-dioxygenase
LSSSSVNREQSQRGDSLHPDTSIGTVRLTVTDIASSRRFYENAIGLEASDVDDRTVSFGVEGKPALLELRTDPSATPLDPRATGLYHFAILVPSRIDLATALARLSDARWPLDGASDHLVSEALYLSDPDGNGIEIYRDRLREEWPRSNGRLEMATLPLDLRSIMNELSSGNGRQPRAPAGTRIGHVHLQVSDLAEAESFYSGILGFDVTVRGYPGALFVSAGGYHHHIGLNTWRSQGSSPPPAGSVGLRSFEVELPSVTELERVLDRVRDAGIEVAERGRAGLVRDPSGNGVLLVAPEG